MTDDLVRPFHLGGGVWLPTPTATFTLHNNQGLIGWRSRNQRCEPPQVLGNGGQNKFVLSASWTAQSKPPELQDALQVREPHLDLLAFMPRLLEALGTSERPGNVPGMLRAEANAQENSLETIDKTDSHAWVGRSHRADGLMRWADRRWLYEAN